MLAITLRKGERVALLQKEDGYPKVIGALTIKPSGSKSLLGITLPKDTLILREKHLDEWQQADLKDLFKGKAYDDAGFDEPHSSPSGQRP